MKKNFINICVMILLSVMFSCENSLEMTLPQGPKGEKGEKGDPGKSAFDLWLEYYGKDQGTTIEDFFNSLKGKDGKDGDVPIIGSNGNWWISGVDTKIPAHGKDGKDGVTPVIGKNGNWYIGGEDTGVPARGKDGFSPYIKEGYWWINETNTLVRAIGQEGKSVKAPTIAIGPGPNYFWVLDGVITDISSKGINGKDGKDGKDGYTPVIGNNGNWWIDGKDTGKPSKVIPSIEANGNWWIDGKDTGKPARGAKGDKGDNGIDGVDGKSAYELWKKAVDKCDGTVKNKDGSAYDCAKNTWEDFLIWLQGGDISVLHEYWKTLPGNAGKTIQQFIDELFDCHCDGITVSVQYTNDCIDLKADGTLAKDHDATLSVGGKKGTSVLVKGEGVNLSGNITNDQTPQVFTIKRGDKDIELTIICTESGNAVTKSALIPALKYIKIDETATVSKKGNEQKDEVVIKFTTAPEEFIVDGVTVYTKSNGLVANTLWTRSTDGKTFTKTYDRLATVQQPTVVAKGANGECSTITKAFTIPTLTPVTVGNLQLDIIDNCDLRLSLTGTSGMTVKASYGSSPVTTITLTESPSGTYTAVVPRAYTAYNINVVSEKAEAGTVTKTITVSGSHLLEVLTPLQLNTVSGHSDNAAFATMKRELKNNTSAPLKVTITRGNNGTSGSLRRTPPELPHELTIPANASVTMDFQRDYTIAYGSGSYTLTFTTENECGLTKTTTLSVSNQTNYTSKFTKPDGFGGNGQPGGPGWNYDTSGDPDVTFVVDVYDAIPNSYIEFQLYKGVGYSAVFRVQANASGRVTKTVKMKASELEAALDNGFGFFKFFSDDVYTAPYNIGATKEKIPFAF